MRFLNNINDFIASVLDTATSSMWAFWLLLIPIIYVISVNPPKDLQTAILDGFSIMFQTVMLIVIQYKSGKEGKTTRELLQDLHNLSMQEHDDTQSILKEVHAKVSQDA